MKYGIDYHLEYYPFDQINLFIQLSSWAHDASGIQLVPLNWKLVSKEKDKYGDYKECEFAKRPEVKAIDP